MTSVETTVGFAYSKPFWTASAAVTEHVSSTYSSTSSEYDTSGFLSSSSPSPVSSPDVAELVESFVYTKLVPTVCAFGIAGNVLNLIVLSRKSLTYTMERMEKSAHCGLMALAVSDLLFCVVTLPNAFYGIARINGSGSFIHESFDFRLVYKLYGNAVVNTFVLSSTWLTVTMAASRYLAICHPLRARQFIGKRFAVASLASVFVVCLLFNLPRLFREEPRTIVKNYDTLTGNGTSPSSTVVYFVYPGPLRRNRKFEQVYDWMYFVLGIVLPLITLVFCNAHLCAALRRSLRMRKESGSSGATRFSFRSKSVGGTSATETTTTIAKNGSLLCRGSIRRCRGERAAVRLTMTLVIIVVMYVTLFVPAELFNFFTDHVNGCRSRVTVYNTALAFGNLLQAVNFAVNFVLYCAVNTHFRQTMCRLAGCEQVRRSPGGKSSFDASVTQSVNDLLGRKASPTYSTTCARRIGAAVGGGRLFGGEESTVMTKRSCPGEDGGCMGGETQTECTTFV
jgi:hypothetical protein